jgi:MFS family permease
MPSQGDLVGKKELAFVVFASSLGTLIEWFDFYIYAILTVVISRKFFPGDLAKSLLASLAALWVGFAVRPFGAVVFGYLGDAIGRKYTFLATLLVMGLSTFAVGLLPTFARVGYAAPMLLVLMRCAQGLALGGEYGGAATYVAEHAPDNRRAFYTSFIQAMATAGLILALLAILVVHHFTGEDAFEAWGWRIPFLLSIFLVALSLWVRSQLSESPIYELLKKTGKTSRSPLRDIGAENWKRIAIALFGAVAGQAVISYTSQIYQLYFMTGPLSVPTIEAYKLAALGIVLGTPFYFVWAAVSDKYGRKWVILSGCLVGGICYWPIYQTMHSAVRVVGATLTINQPLMVLMLFAQMLIVTMVSGPMIAMLVEMFPAKVRYTCISIPYHLGNGEFGGLTPLIATSLSLWWSKRYPHDPNGIYMGLIWPIGIAFATVLIGGLFLKESRGTSIWAEVES